MEKKFYAVIRETEYGDIATLAITDDEQEANQVARIYPGAEVVDYVFTEETLLPAWMVRIDAYEGVAIRPRSRPVLPDEEAISVAEGVHIILLHAADAQQALAKALKMKEDIKP